MAATAATALQSIGSALSTEIVKFKTEWKPKGKKKKPIEVTFTVTPMAIITFATLFGALQAEAEGGVAGAAGVPKETLDEMIAKIALGPLGYFVATGQGPF